MRAEHQGLVDVAASVADGNPVDWNAVQLRDQPADQRLIRHLRLVESIANLHRSIPSPVKDDDLESDIAVASANHDRAQLATPGTGPHWGRLTLLDRIGQGTSGEVYRAFDTTLHREVALKLLKETAGASARREAQTRLLEEARRLARVHHQHVVQVYGAEEHDRRVGLWMELVRGESLEQAVTSRGVFGPREAVLIGLDVCSALAAVHAAGLLHRDVKAQNVMREEGGRTVLMDFGTGEELAGTNRLVGTPLYLAPEIFRGQRASVQSDLYSLGVLLYYMVSGRFPVVASSMEDLHRAHAERRRTPLRDLRPDVPEAFIRTVERALDSDPTRRFQSVGDLEASLREALDAAPAAARAVPMRPVRRWKFSPTFAMASAVLAAAVIALVVWTGRPFTSTQGPINSLAVLPLSYPASQHESSELSDAMTEQLIATIGQIDALRPTTFSSTQRFKGTSESATAIAKALGVDAVLDGVLTVVDDVTGGPGKLRLDAKLIAAGTGLEVWRGSATRRRGDSAALLSDIARAISFAVHAPVSREETVRLKQTKRTNRAAEEAYLQGRFQLTAYGADAAQRALDAFKRAIAADPDYAAAHASAAVAYLRLASFNKLSHGEARQNASAEIRSAYAAGDDIAEAHAADADVKFLYDWDWQGAEREYQRSLELNSSYLPARNNYAQVLAARKRFEPMLRISEESLSLDPQSAEALVNHGLLLYYKGDHAAADEYVQRALAMQPGSGFAMLLRSRIAEAQGRYAEALDSAREAKRLARDAGVNLEVVIIRLLVLNQDDAEARKEIARLEKAGREGTERVRPRDLAYIYTAQGRTADALDQFERAFDERDFTLVWLTVDPRVDSLRKEPRFQAILQKIGLE